MNPVFLTNRGFCPVARNQKSRVNRRRATDAALKKAARRRKLSGYKKLFFEDKES